MSNLDNMNARDALLVTPADADLAKQPAMALYINGAGNLRVTTVSGTDILIPVPANFVLNLQVKRVWATNTTATGIVAFYMNKA